MTMNLTPCLWFDDEAEAAAEFYTSVFPGSRITKVTRVPEGGPRPAGGVLTAEFELDGKPFMALNQMVKVDIAALQRAHDGV